MDGYRSEEHTSELQSLRHLVCRLLLEKKPRRSPDCWPRRSRGSAGCGSPARRTLFPFFFNDTATTEIYTLSLHDALPISLRNRSWALPFSAEIKFGDKRR